MTTLTAEALCKQVGQPTAIKGKSEDVCRRAGLDPYVLEDAARLFLAMRPGTEYLPTGAVITLGILFALVALEDTQ